MAYIINKYDGTAILELQDGTISQNLPVKLIGKNYPGYGEAFNENFLFLLENFSKTTAPNNSIRGQLWYDLSQNKLKIQNQNGLWKSVSGAEVSDTEPTEQGLGSFWFDNTTKQLYVYDGSQHNVIGPEVSTGFGITRLQSTVVTDTVNVTHPVIYGYVDAELVLVIAKSDFTVSGVTGFTTIKRGVNLKDGFNITGNVTGNASTATALQNTVKINGVNFDGTSNINIPSILSNKLIPGNYILGQQFDGSTDLSWNINGSNMSSAGTLVARDDNGNFVANIITSNLVGNVTGNVTGNASTATALQNTVKINGVNFDGTANITIPSTTSQKLSAGGFIIGQDFDGSLARIWSVDATAQNVVNKVVSRDGVGNFSANIITSSLVGNVTGNVSGNVTGNLTGNVSGNVSGNVTGNLTGNVSGNVAGNANTANKLTTSRKINGVNFDGTMDITVLDDSKLPLSGGTLTNYLTLHANPSQPFHAATKEYVDSMSQSGMPVGTIVMWYGSRNTVPSGWKVCDGTNGTPDLRDRFPMGAGSRGNGQTGGSAAPSLPQHSHNINKTVSTSDSGRHTHTLNVTGAASTSGAHSHNITDAGHHHGTWGEYFTDPPYGVYDSKAQMGSSGGRDYDNKTYNTSTDVTGVVVNSGGAHTHSISVTGSTDNAAPHNHSVSITGSTDQQGSSNPEGNLPPYYTVWFIMKG